MTSTSSPKNNDIAQLDSLTGGAFSAPTAGERAARVRDWLLTQPGHELLAEVFKELSVKDKGAAKLVREKLDEAKRAKGQESLAAEWADKATALLAMAKLNIADALAWQRDAAKAGAPLSKEPLAGLKTQLVERVRVIEDLQRQVQVQREAAVLLAQRIEVLVHQVLGGCAGCSGRLAGRCRALAVASGAVGGRCQLAQCGCQIPTPAGRVPRPVAGGVGRVSGGLGARRLRLRKTPRHRCRPCPCGPTNCAWPVACRSRHRQSRPSPSWTPKCVPRPTPRCEKCLTTLETEIAEGHGKASAGAAAALRHALKEFGRVIDDKLENQAHAALAAAGELEGWQRWRADQLREELVAKAEGLLKRPEGQAIGGRKMQETLRTLRDQWKQTDQGGVPNHAMWKRFDEACNEAHKVVEAWLEKVKAESAEHKAQRLALIEEVNAWAAANPTALDDDWKGFNRILHQFGDRWREAGHLGEKAFAELQPLWKAAIAKAAAPLEALQAQSLALRHAMIEEAKVLGAAPVLRVDAVQALQQRWQAQAHAVPMDRRQEQKLWDAFRKPIDDAFNRKIDGARKGRSRLGRT